MGYNRDIYLIGKDISTAMSEPFVSRTDRHPALEPGMVAPDFSLIDENGQSVSLHHFRGGPVILTFFGNDWDPARSEHLSRYNELLQDAMTIDGETPETGTLLHIAGEGISRRFSFGKDPADQIALLAPSESERAVAEQYGVTEQQAVFVISGDGTIRWRFIAPRGVYPRPEAVRDALRESVGKTPVSIPLTRRDFLATTLAAAFLLALQPLGARVGRAAEPAVAPPLPAPGTIPVTLNVNGTKHTLNLEPRVTLLDALREYIGLTGSKKGCDQGQCGACTVHVEGKRINSCLTLAVMQQNRPITTIEGLAKGDTLHPVQAAFIKHDGFQCGYCTPGQIMSAVALLQEGHAHSTDDVRELMSGNICRCGAYPNIVAAIEEVRTGTAVAREGGSRDATV